MEKVNNTKNVLLIFDGNLVSQAKILIAGLRESLSGDVLIHCIVSQEVYSKYLQDLLDFAKRIGIRIVFCEVEHEIFDQDTGSVSEIIYQKFLFPRLFPDLNEKILYLDIDIVPIQNFDELFEVNFSVPFGAVALDDMISRNKSQNWKKIANGGVQLFNTDLYLQDNLMQRAIDYYRNFSDKSKLTDEIVLNLLTKKGWIDLGSRYNTPYTKTWYTWVPKKRREIKLVHVIGTRQPWNKHFTSPFAYRYLQVYRRRAKRFNVLR